MGKGRPKLPPVKLEPLVLLEDEPVPDHGTDELGLTPFARTIAEAAVGTGGPFTIGVYGDWGYGKTSVLRQAKSLVDVGRPDVVTVWFNAWQYEAEEHLIVPLVATMVREIERKPKSVLEKAGGAWQKLTTTLRAIAYGFSAKAKVKLPGLAELEAGFVAKEMIDRERQITAGADPLLERSLYYDAFERLDAIAGDWAGEAHAPRLVVFVDDLDRCLPDNGLRLLEGIKLVLAQPGFVFVLAVDRPVLADYLRKRYVEQYGLADPEKATHYLDKIVQLPFPIPSHEGRFQEYLARLLDRRPALTAASGLAPVLLELADLLAAGSGHNPRSLVRFINNLLVDLRVFRHVGGEEAMEVTEAAFVKTIAVSRALRSHLRASTYSRLIEDDQYCEGLAERGARLRYEPEEGVPLLPHRKELAETLPVHGVLPKLLEVPLVREWLRSHDLRRKVDKFLAVHRRGTTAEPEPEPEAEENPVHAAIRKALGKKPGEAWTDEQLQAITGLNLRDEQVTEADLAQLATLRGLQSLVLSGTQVSDAGLVHLAALEGLRVLELSGTKVSDAGLVHVTALSEVQALWLDGTAVSDAGLEHLAALTGLRHLFLSGTAVSDAGLEHLAALTGLGYLDLSGTQVSDAGLEHLAALTRLMELRLNRTQVGDAGLEHLAALKWLLSLRLDGTQVSDAGLEHLAALTRLTHLWLNGTQVTEAGVAKLRQALPNCTIHH